MPSHPHIAAPQCRLSRREFLTILPAAIGCSRTARSGPATSRAVSIPGPLARVGRIGGVPTFVLDGKPLLVPGFETYAPQERYFRQFAEAGASFFTFNTNAAPCDYGHSAPTRLDAVLPTGANPTLPQNRPFPSLASPQWRAAIGDALARFIEHVQRSRFGAHVIGYFLSGMHTEEFYHSACNTPQFAGYSDATLAAFRAWLRRRYGDLASLQDAWIGPRSHAHRRTRHKPCARFRLTTGLLLLSACAARHHSPLPDQEPAPLMESRLRTEPSQVRAWADRLGSDDPQIRSAAADALIQGAQGSLPLLKQLLDSHDEALRWEVFEVVRRIGPMAIPWLADVLRHGRASVRQQAVSILIDLAPDTESIQPALQRALQDEDSLVARDAARALGALGKKAGPSVRALVKVLSHGEQHVRLYAAEALASIGPHAAPATKNLAMALRDPIPGVRWASCEALASIGPAAASAVPQLIEALNDEFLYVRICAAGALGNVGPEAAPALGALRAAAQDPAVRAEVQWALNRITGEEAGDPADVSAAIITPVPLQPQEPPAHTGNPPLDWDIKTNRNIAWSVPLGDDTFGRPVVSGDVVYVGTDNARRLNSAFQDECGVLLAFRATDGQFLWQDLAPRVKRGLREFLLPSTTSAAYVEGNRLYYVTAECQLRCLDTQGFRDGENNGPFQAELFQNSTAADMIWELDFCARLGVFPHEAANSEVLPVGDLLMVCTSNGRNEGHTRVPSPRAPGLIAVDKESGEVVWRAVGAGEHVLHGQWCSPTAAHVNGRVQVLFGGGDGWLRSYDAASGRELWRFDGNAKDARWLPRPGVLSRSSIIASPVYEDGRVFLAMGQDPTHGDGPSLLHAISPNGRGDVTESRRLWTCREVGRVIGTPIVSNGLLYVGDLGGTVHCLEAATGTVVWKHDTKGAIWGCLWLAGDRLYAGNEDGRMTVLRAGPRAEVLAEIQMDAPLYARPAQAENALYLATACRLYLIAAKPQSR